MPWEKEGSGEAIQSFTTLQAKLDLDSVHMMLYSLNSVKWAFVKGQSAGAKIVGWCTFLLFIYLIWH